MDFKIGIFSIHPFLEMILKQEGIPFEDIDQDNFELINKYALIITDYDESDMIELISEKFHNEILVINPTYIAKRYFELLKTRTPRITIPLSEFYKNPSFKSALDRSFLADFYGDSGLFKDYKVIRIKNNNENIYMLSISLEESFLFDKSCRKQFFDFRKELPSEVVGKKYIYEIRNIILQTINIILYSKNIPLIHKSYIPQNSLFIFRIDTDFCTKEEAENLYKLCQKYDIKATWFLDTYNEKTIRELYAKMADQELGFHCSRHLVFDNYEENFQNIQSGLSILKKHGIKPKGYAAPFGEWNSYLQKAIEKSGFLYSSEFSYDYDNLPSYPIASNVLQIPIHPISCGRLRRSHYTDNEKIAYYKRVIDEKIDRNEPVILYHHPHHKKLNVIEEIFRYVKLKKMQNLTMNNYRIWWQKREKRKLEYVLNKDKIFLQKNPKIPLIIDYEGKRVIDNFSESVKYKDLEYKNYPFFLKNDPKRQEKWNWRNWLYKYESWKGRRKV
ncbi:MAG: polysaccharide deacetylase family protein [Candidatus Cloacimonetes bacterium]|nr:polysaccharide deacetylase family protein [Candidatus Cloacimonadota bacterium]